MKKNRTDHDSIEASVLETSVSPTSAPANQSNTATSTTPTQVPESDDKNLENFTLSRDGLPPIVFVGSEIGYASDQTHNSSRWQTVRIYRSRAGRYIVRDRRDTCWQGEHDTVRASSFAIAAQAIKWLQNSDGKLSVAAQLAVEAAAENDEGLAGAWMEQVE